MLVDGSRKPGSIPCQPRFPRAGWVSTEAKKDQGGLRPPRGHPEATLRLPRGYGWAHVQAFGDAAQRVLFTCPSQVLVGE
jgi:hypothetical protein